MINDTYPNEIAVRLERILKSEEEQLSFLQRSGKASKFSIAKQVERVNELQSISQIASGYGNLYYWKALRTEMIKLLEKDGSIKSFSIQLGSVDFGFQGFIQLNQMNLENV